MSQKARQKGGRKSLARGKPRLLDRHDGAEGRSYDAAYAALEEGLGPFRTRLLRFEAGRTAITRLNLEATTRALTAARRARERGRGRRPSVQAVERLAKRQGLADQTYSQAIARLEELAARNGKPDLARTIAEAQRSRG